MEEHITSVRRHLVLCAYYAIFPAEKSSEDFLRIGNPNILSTRLHICISSPIHTRTHAITLTNIIVNVLSTHTDARNNRIVIILFSSCHFHLPFRHTESVTGLEPNGTETMAWKKGKMTMNSSQNIWFRYTYSHARTKAPEKHTLTAVLPLEQNKQQSPTIEKRTTNGSHLHTHTHFMGVTWAKGKLPIWSNTHNNNWK